MAQQTIDAVQFQPEIVEEPETFNSLAVSNEEWRKQNLLSLDGGGMRGLWSLYAVEKLMEYIAEVEEEFDGDDGPHLHSFEPIPWPPSLKLEPVTDDEIQQFEHAAGRVEEQVTAIAKARRYLPCHYFDCICGSSTGALIAIMLGRFRMSVTECIKEYMSLGHKVFGNPRHITSLRFMLIDREKYDEKKLREVFEDVTKRRCEKAKVGYERMRFPHKRGVCRTFVTTIMGKEDQDLLGEYELIRSYDHTKRRPAKGTATGRSNTATHGASSRTGTINNGANDAGPSRTLTGPRHTGTGLTGQSSIRYPGLTKRSGTNHWEAHDFELWEVARAATAAPHYFKSLKIQHRSGSGFLEYKDGGLNYANNPTKEGKREIEEEYGSENLGIVVSVGTCRRNDAPKKKWPQLKSTVNQAFQMLGDPETVHKEMKEAAQNQDTGFKYFRLDHPGRLRIALDEWKPHSTLKNKISIKQNKKAPGSDTCNEVKAVFNEWAVKNETTRMLRDCAEQLVQRRRARIANESKWERFAIGVKFTCRILNCNGEDNFLYRDQFTNHLREVHGLNKTLIELELIESKKYWRYQG